MPLQRVDPDDHDAVAETVTLLNAARAVDDPDCPAETVELTVGQLHYGWDLHPEIRYLYRAEKAGPVVGVLGLNVPPKDNVHLVEGDFVIHPQQRGRGHGAAMFDELIALVRDLGRSTIWLFPAEGDEVAAGFLRRRGFGFASHETRRIQRLADVDRAELERSFAAARRHATGYRLERLLAPTPDAVLAELTEVVSAINDAPMGELDFTDETFDLDRLHEVEAAAERKGERLYQVIARRESDGRIGGHTVMIVQPLRPERAEQYNTAVHRDHRGHRLGLLLKIDMLRWLAEAEPQLQSVETWNNTDNAYMIKVNEQLGYRVSKTFDAYQRVLDPLPDGDRVDAGTERSG